MFPESTWIEKDCHKTGLRDNSLDIIFAMQILEHIDNLKEFIDECYRILKEGWMLLMTVPDGYKIQHESHCWIFDSIDIINLLKESNFRNVDTFLINNNKVILGIGKK